MVNYSRSEQEAEETARACEQAGAQTLLMRCDVADEPTVIAMFDAIKQKFGRLDVCATTPARPSPHSPRIYKISAEEWDRSSAST